MSIELNAELRTDMGKGASRRLRRANKLPAIVYGAGKDPENLTLEQKDVQHQLQNEAFYTQVLDLNVNGKTTEVLLRDLQHHPYKMEIASSSLACPTTSHYNTQWCPHCDHKHPHTPKPANPATI